MDDSGEYERDDYDEEDDEDNIERDDDEMPHGYSSDPEL